MTWLANAVERVLCFAARRTTAAVRFWQAGRREYRMSLRETARDLCACDYDAEEKVMERATRMGR